MKENQHIGWKRSWQDEYLKWICGFANAEGGMLVIGKDDKGKVVGVANAGKLLENLPNKVRDLLGIMVDVNLRQRSIALKEANETLYWLELLHQTEYIAGQSFESIRPDSEELIKLLVAIVKTSKNVKS